MTTGRCRSLSLLMALFPTVLFQFWLIPQQILNEDFANESTLFHHKINNQQKNDKNKYNSRNNSNNKEKKRNGEKSHGGGSIGESEEDINYDDDDGHDDDDKNTMKQRQRQQEHDEKEEPNDEYFGACLLIMDDNHLLSEWLAYHYTFLPLKRLIVAIDPNSKTSPTRIFNKFRPYINITEWDDDDYNFVPHYTDLIDIHRSRQRTIIRECIKQLKKENQTKWVAFIDSDEFIVPNRRSRYKIKLSSSSSSSLSGVSNKTTVSVSNNNNNNKNHKNNHGNDYGVNVKEQTTMTLIEIFQQNKHLNNQFKSPCFPMNRYPVSIKESPKDKVFHLIPSGINATSLLTTRYRYPRYPKDTFYPGKCLVDISRISMKDDIKHNNHNTHRPVRTYCSDHDMSIPPSRSPMSVFHYAGTLEAFLYRNDPRQESRSVENYQHTYGETEGTWEDDNARFWLPMFVDRVGSIETAQYLLSDAGVIAS